MPLHDQRSLIIPAVKGYTHSSLPFGHNNASSNWLSRSQHRPWLSLYFLYKFHICTIGNRQTNRQTLLSF